MLRSVLKPSRLLRARFLSSERLFAANENPVLDLPANVSDEHFQRNYEENKRVAEEYRRLVAQNIRGGSDAAHAKHFARGKMLPRQRISRVLDPGSPFLEFNQIASHEVYPEPCQAGGIVCGIGKIKGQLCMVMANDATVRAGTYYPLTIKKQTRSQEIAHQNKLPCVYLVDSGGINLNLQDEVFPDKGHFGSLFYNMAQMSADNIPQISVAFGGCTAGGAYQISMADENVIVDKTGFSFLGGPALTKAATGEDISMEDLGGAKLHSERSGVTDHFAHDEKHAIQIVRDIVSNLNTESHFDWNTASRIDPEEPLFPADHIYGVIPPKFTEPFNIMQLIAHLVDGSRFHEFKKLYGPTIKCGWARLYGHMVGIVANDGVIYSESAMKAAHFIQMCSVRGIPIVFLHNIAGFMVGSQVERSGISKHGAKMVQAVSNCRSPKLSFYIGASYGAGNYAMCGRGFNPRFLWTLNTAQLAVMGGQQAAGVLSSVGKSNKSLSPEEQKRYTEEKVREFENQSSPIYHTARIRNDGIVQPHEMRRVLAMSLEATLHAPIPDKKTNVFRM